MNPCSRRNPLTQMRGGPDADAMRVEAENPIRTKVRRMARLFLVACLAGAATATTAFMIVTLRFRDPTLHPDIVTGFFILGLAATAVAIVLTIVLWRHWARWLLIPLLPGLLVPFIIGVFMMPISAHVSDISLPNGETAHLAIAPMLTDTVYDLWLGSGPIWRRVDTDLEYSEDGRFIGDEKLALSRDGRRLLVGRGGIWTDCLAIASNFAPCAIGLQPAFWGDPDFETKMRDNSAKIAGLL